MSLPSCVTLYFKQKYARVYDMDYLSSLFSKINIVPKDDVIETVTSFQAKFDYSDIPIIVANQSLFSNFIILPYFSPNEIPTIKKVFFKNVRDEIKLDDIIKKLNHASVFEIDRYASVVHTVVDVATAQIIQKFSSLFQKEIGGVGFTVSVCDYGYEISLTIPTPSFSKELKEYLNSFGTIFNIDITRRTEDRMTLIVGYTTIESAEKLYEAINDKDNYKAKRFYLTSEDLTIQKCRTKVFKPLDKKWFVCTIPETWNKGTVESKLATPLLTFERVAICGFKNTYIFSTEASFQPNNHVEIEWTFARVEKDDFFYSLNRVISKSTNIFPKENQLFISKIPIFLQNTPNLAAIFGDFGRLANVGISFVGECHGYITFFEKKPADTLIKIENMQNGMVIGHRN
ncbi:hypothetical protein EIN_525880 [Entamoeba invadens IP1]|uniref:RRM domain-containing protein n=1 Tax=Entamoeba invadens IP1 TaxID=370355 RepID=A0A0A1U5I8_ENTIV|nr:hypothetical protein EIN_525880 [Entamoeba invadens IP1]ELP89593.1 hypothetical protein EIN_525880 [Entamoeba invadens IP1]|eukprot:XP_004256364.1 hypothetical protein EIN_525880 [Entamoeba invadens IP1]